MQIWNEIGTTWFWNVWTSLYGDLFLIKHNECRNRKFEQSQWHQLKILWTTLYTQKVAIFEWIWLFLPVTRNKFEWLILRLTIVSFGKIHWDHRDSKYTHIESSQANSNFFSTNFIMIQANLPTHFSPISYVDVAQSSL